MIGNMMGSATVMELMLVNKEGTRLGWNADIGTFEPK
jgi:hypothetical protein